MDPIYKSLPEYIETDQYFVDARNWYKYKYIHPFSQRSFVLIVSFTAAIILAGIIININGLFPTVTQIRYSISSTNIDNSIAKITRADQFQNDPLSSITDIMIRNYVTKREQYRYDDLKKQFIFVKNNSTRIAFRKFYNFMSLDNPSSPVMNYQRNAHRTVNIISTDYLESNKVVIQFNTTAKDKSSEIIEDITFEAIINYEIDKITTELKPGSRFNFTVTNYQLKQIKDNLK